MRVLVRVNVVMMRPGSAEPPPGERLRHRGDADIQPSQKLHNHGIARRQHAVFNKTGWTVQIAKLVTRRMPFHRITIRAQQQQVFWCGPDDDGERLVLIQHIAVLQLHAARQ